MLVAIEATRTALLSKINTAPSLRRRKTIIRSTTLLLCWVQCLKKSCSLNCWVAGSSHDRCKLRNRRCQMILYRCNFFQGWYWIMLQKFETKGWIQTFQKGFEHHLPGLGQLSVEVALICIDTRLNLFQGIMSTEELIN